MIKVTKDATIILAPTIGCDSIIVAAIATIINSIIADAMPTIASTINNDLLRLRSFILLLSCAYVYIIKHLF